MHFLTMLTVFTIALLIRYQSGLAASDWSSRWYRTLFCFLFPPLLLLSTAVTILYMGCHGEMLGIRAGTFGCIVSGILLLFALGTLIRLAYLANCSLDSIREYPEQSIGSTTAKIINTDFPYSGRIGFWQSHLIITQGLLQILDEEHLATVIAHEQAHLFYRDTFWFFWLGWIRAFSFWLPKTELLWQELLLLRELRADRQAAESVDFLLLAESLLTLAQAPLQSTPIWGVSFNDSQIGDRLEERIDSLLQDSKSVPDNPWYRWSWIYLLFLPLLTIPLHFN